MGKVIALANQKGGVGKTTTAINLGAALTEQGRQVLLVDMDPQGALSVGLDLAAAEIQLAPEVGRERALTRVLRPLRGRYDYLLIDCPPSLGLLTVNALNAADGVLIPLECEYFALRGMALLMDTIEKVREDINPDLEIVGILATMYDSRTVHGREVLGRVEDAFGGRVFRTVIAKTIRFAEAPVAGESILTYAGSSSGAVAYRELAKEVLAS